MDAKRPPYSPFFFKWQQIVDLLTQLAEVVEYADFIFKASFPSVSVLDRTLNSIWWWGSSPGALAQAKYITSRSTIDPEINFWIIHLYIITIIVINFKQYSG